MRSRPTHGIHESTGATDPRSGEYVGRVEATAHVDGVGVTRLRDHVDYPVARHTHDRAHFCLVLRARYLTGAGAASQGVEVLPVEAGTILVHPPGTTHADRFLEPGGRFLAVDVDASLIGESSHPIASVRVNDPQALLLALRIEHHLDAPRGAGVDALPDLAAQLFGLVGDGCDASPEPSWVHEAEVALRDCVREGVRLGELAHELGIHPVTLTRGFRRHRGVVPSVYLGRLRLARAVRILGSRPNARLSTVALEAGFADQAHLTHRFREALGVPPGRWRRGR